MKQNQILTGLLAILLCLSLSMAALMGVLEQSVFQPETLLQPLEESGVIQERTRQMKNDCLAFAQQAETDPELLEAFLPENILMQEIRQRAEALFAGQAYQPKNPFAGLAEKLQANLLATEGEEAADWQKTRFRALEEVCTESWQRAAALPLEDTVRQLMSDRQGKNVIMAGSFAAGVLLVCLLYCQTGNKRIFQCVTAASVFGAALTLWLLAAGFRFAPEWIIPMEKTYGAVLCSWLQSAAVPTALTGAMTAFLGLICLIPKTDRTE